MEILILVVFILGYVFITLEHKLKISKSATALSMGGILWILVSISGVQNIKEILFHTGSEIFEIVIFLLAAMSLVEILTHYQLFDLIQSRICRLGFDARKQFFLLSTITFFLSGIVDNLTITIISVQIARSLFKGKNLLIIVSSIIIAANAGGAFSPIGDITTIMLWLAGKFDSLTIIQQGFFPSLALFTVSTIILGLKIKNTQCKFEDKKELKLSRSEKLIISMSLTSFVLPLAMSAIGLPPYLGLLLGLGLVWLVIDVFKQRSQRVTHLEASIEEIIKKTDLSSLKFFIGILLAVSALDSIGVLEDLTSLVYRSSLTNDVIIGNILLGPISAVLDNVPLTAIAIKTVHNGSPELWSLLAITVGTGGSFLVIGSAAGIIAMGLVEKLNFKNYFQIAFIPMFFGYISAVLVWLAQFYIF